MDFISNLSLGFGVALSAQNLGYCFIGALLGTVVGVLPGIGPVTTVAMLLPISFTLPPVSALIMLAGIYYGAQYGGSTTAILVNIPGEASSVVTCLDGYAMARKGRAGAALGIAAFGSFIAGILVTIALFSRSGRIRPLSSAVGSAAEPTRSTRFIKPSEGLRSTPWWWNSVRVFTIMRRSQV